MRDLRHRAHERRRSTPTPARDERHARPPRPRFRRRAARRAGRPRRAPALDHRPREAATSRSRTRTAPSTSSRTGRSTTSGSCGRSWSGRGTDSRPAPTPKCSSTSTSSTARASPSGSVGCSPSRSGTRAAAGSWSRATGSASSRSTTGTPAASSRSRPSCAPCPRGEVDPDALEAFLAFNSVPAPFSIFAGTRKLPAGHLLVWEDGETRVERYARPVPAEVARRGFRRAGRGAARAAPRLRAGAPDRRRPRRRVALRRRGLVAARGARRPGERRAGAHVLDRVRGALVRRARRCALGRSMYGTRHEELTLRPGRRAPPARARRGLRRAVRRLVGASDLPRLRAGGAARQGRALRRGRRRALRRLLHLRRRSPRAPRRPPRSLARPLVERLPSLEPPGELRLQGEAIRPRGRICPRSSATTRWKEIFSPDVRAELTGRRARLRPRRPLPRPLRGDGGRRAAGAAAGRRPRHLPRRRPAREDRPGLDGALARGARAVPRPVVAEPRARAADAGSRCAGCAKKVLLRKAAAPLVPARIVYGRKRGFSIPAAAWLRGELEPFARETLSRRRRCAGRASSGPRPVSGCSTEHVAGEEDLARQLWGLLAFTLWHERHVERDARSAARAATGAQLVA